jgi:hypothetical protein
MLIKVRKEDEGWLLFDNAEQVAYHETHNVSASTAIDKIILADPEVADIFDSFLILKTTHRTKISDAYPVKVSSIHFSRLDHDKTVKRYAVVFDTIGYICNDTGKTFEKVLAK